MHAAAAAAATGDPGVPGAGTRITTIVVYARQSGRAHCVVVRTRLSEFRHNFHRTRDGSKGDGGDDDTVHDRNGSAGQRRV